MTGENVVYLSDLTFDKLNNNDCNAVFRLLGDDEIEDLFVNFEVWGRMSHKKPSKGTIDSWFFFSITQGGRTYTSLLGISLETGGPYITSPVVAIAPDILEVITESGSLYNLWEKSDDEQPYTSLVLHIVQTLRRRGMGQIVKDWPEVIC